MMSSVFTSPKRNDQASAVPLCALGFAASLSLWPLGSASAETWSESPPNAGGPVVFLKFTRARPCCVPGPLSVTTQIRIELGAPASTRIDITEDVFPAVLSVSKASPEEPEFPFGSVSVLNPGPPLEVAPAPVVVFSENEKPVRFVASAVLQSSALPTQAGFASKCNQLGKLLA